MFYIFDVAKSMCNVGFDTSKPLPFRLNLSAGLCPAFQWSSVSPVINRINPIYCPKALNTHPAVRHGLVDLSSPAESVENVEKCHGDVDEYNEGEEGI